MTSVSGERDVARAISVDGATRLYVIVGDPIAQVKSPGGMSQAFAHLGRNAVLVPMHVAPENLPAVLEGLDRTRNVDGIVATIPHKFACADWCRTTSARARFLSAVNVMRRLPGGGWEGDALDGLGFLTAAITRGARPEGGRALLVGAGGAGSAIALALAEAGVRELSIHDADVTRRHALMARLSQLRHCSITVGSKDPSGYDFVANATPAGMKADDPVPVDPGRLSPSAFVGCVVTQPEVTPLIAAARNRGCATSTGTDMYRGVQTRMLEFFSSDPLTPPPRLL